ncbi:MAG: MFS transporter [Nitrososphaerota archaeon]|nr:MFS transporter [Nitrososphaerota archaeon]
MYGPSRSEVAKLVLGTVTGSVIEWYAFDITAIAASIAWPYTFFQRPDAFTGLLFSLSVYGLAFLARPLGGFVFGHFGDRYGRRATLTWTLVTMGVCTLGIGLTPSHAGEWSVALIALFTFMQGFAIGGEWGGVSTWITEYAARSRRRAFWTSWVNQGLALGLVLATAAFSVLISTLGDAGFVAGAWRIPFYVGAAATVPAVVVRMKMVESPLFDSLQKRSQVERAPAFAVLRKMWRLVLLMVAAWFSVPAVSYVVTSFSPAYLKLSGMPAETGPLSISIATVALMGLILLTGLLGDRVGRRRVLLLSQALGFVLAVPYFLLLNTGDPLLVIAGQTLFYGATQFGLSVISAYLAEQFPGRYRYSGAGMSFQIGALLGGGLAPVVASYLMDAFGGPKGSWIYIAGLMMAYSAVSMAATLASRETVNRELD